MNLPALCNNIFPKFLLFSSNVSPLVYYSHLAVMAVSLIFGLFILFNGRKFLLNRTFFLTIFAFIAWVFLDSIFWASNRSDTIMFVWSLQILVEPLVYIGAFYFIHLIATKKDLPFNFKLTAGLLYLPVVILLATRYTLTGFDLTSCLPLEGFIGYYDYAIEFIFTFWLLLLVIKTYHQSTNFMFKKQLKQITIGVFLFLFSFSWGNLISSLTENWQISQIGLFAMPIFIGFLVYSIIKFRSFNIKLTSIQALVSVLVLLVASQFIFIQDKINMILNGGVFILVIIFGYLLVQSVKKQIEQEKKILEESHSEEDKKITELLYEHNLELAVKNKTLSLLEKLYQTSVLTLTPEALAKSITDEIRADLNLELAGILDFDEKTDSLIPLAFSKSLRLTETLKKLGFLLKDIKITDVSKRDFFKKVVYEKTSNMTDNLEEVWHGLIKQEDLTLINSESHTKTILLYPLVAAGETLGVLIFGLNRAYDTLNTFEKESIKSFINVIALSLDKSYLYKDLQDANNSMKELIKQRESLVHLVTHKVKGSFTRSKYIFACMVDGTFGEITPMLKKWAQQGFDSDNMGIETVDLILNADNLQKGTVKYDLKNMDMRSVVENVFAEKSKNAEAKGLEIKSEIKEGNYNVMGDVFWLKEVVNNFIDNAIHYTKEGKILVGLENKNGKVVLSVKDTGVGITDEDKKNLFTEGGRGRDSVKVNVDSTGYGLFSVKLIMDAHKGRVWAESEGPGKGSAFFAELDSI